ncbi:MAG: four helix bundle protein [Bacteroidota bacterium]|nr:four helix bundle protein [Bacteroidota bacterium]
MFRFENLEIWKRSIQITDEIFNIADIIESKHHYRFADQLRGAVLSISNNIAEGSGSSSKRDFTQFLNYTHRSIFETVNMLIIACRRKYINEDQKNNLRNELEEISKMVSGFSRSLNHKIKNTLTSVL